MQPRVLIICDRATERETIRVLVGTMGCQWVLASSVQEGLTVLGRERATAVLVELSETTSDFAQMQANLRELMVRFPGRVLVLTDETPSPEVTDLIAKYSVPSVQLGRLTMDLWPCLESMVYPQLGIRRITQVARLILDTFLRPLPAGIRFILPDSRQLVYEAKALSADISFERHLDSQRTMLVGQIMSTGEPRLPLSGLSVVLKGQQGSLGMRTSNESGEFAFEFQNELRITLEIEVAPNQWVAIISPTLDWGSKEEHLIVGASVVEPPSTMQSRPNGKKR